MNEQTFANVRVNRGKLHMAIVILACFLGLILLAQPSTHSQIGEQPQQGKLALSSLGVTASNRNPLQIALLHVMGRTPGITLHRPTSNLRGDHFGGTPCEPKADHRPEECL
jgi:hypothetical protein